jgi:hypothetical protein
MSYTYLQDAGGVSSAASYSDIEPFALLRLNLIVATSYTSDSATESCRRSQSGMTSQPLTGSRGADVLTSFLAAFPAKISAPPEKAQVSTENDRDYGENSPGLLAKYDLDTHSWKTAQYLLLGGLEEYSETWPKWGMMRSGECWERTTLARPIKEIEFGLWPTPCARDYKGGRKPEALEEAGRTATNSLPDAIIAKEGYGGQLNPTWVEWLMGWPLAWTDLRPLATDKSQQWQRSHGKHLPEVEDDA